MTHPSLTRVLTRFLTSILSAALCAAALCAAPSRAAAQTPPSTGVKPPPATAEPPAPIAILEMPKPTALPRKGVPGAPAGWQRYEFGTPRLFAVSLPAKHEFMAEFLMLGGGKPSSAYTYAGETDDGSYLASVIENLPFDAARMPEKMKNNFYDGIWEGMVSGIKKDMEKNGLLLTFEPGPSRPAKVGGIDGREQDFKLGVLKGRVRTALSGNRVFLVLLMEPTDADISNTGLAFLDSLEVYAPTR